MIKRHRQTRQNRKNQKPKKQRCFTRHHGIEQKVNTQRQRQGGGIHEGMATAAFRLPMIRDAAHNGIRHRINTGRDHQCQTAKGSRNPQHLVEIKQQENAEDAVFEPLCQLPKPVGKFNCRCQHHSCARRVFTLASHEL